ncbi:MAG: trypsin-like peptidase domain-containing protein [Oscillospiraceae bacterium]|nr:trypsin-like peptidase domain-containing protein [Oscillospiraceae bacterium]
MNDNFNENENRIDENVQSGEPVTGDDGVVEATVVEESDAMDSHQETATDEEPTTESTSGAGSYTSTGNSQSTYTQNPYSYSGQNYSYGSYNSNQTGNRSEYVYSTPTPKKKGNGGKVAIGIIVGILAVFVVSVTAISAYIALSGDTFETTNRGNDIDNSKPATTTQTTTEEDEVVLDESEDETSLDVVADDSTAEASSREYPTLEQFITSDGSYTLTEIYEKVSPSVVGVSSTTNSGSATGTGIILTEDGYILTCAHVVEDATTIAIVDSEMNQYEATLIGEDSQSDIAVLKIDAEGLTAAELGVSSDLKVGEAAIVIGNPLGYDLYGSMSVGIVSGLNRTLNINGKDMTLIQTDASVNSGNSGGPMVNAYGQVIGIISAKVSSSYGEGLGFAIPIDDALPIVNDLIQYGYVTGRPSIGITGEDITVYVAFYYGIPQGVMVRYVTPDSGADIAGVEAYDIIVGVNDETITTMDELTNIKNNYSVGDTITLNIYRNGTYIDLEVELMEITG